MLFKEGGFPRLYEVVVKWIEIFGAVRRVRLILMDVSIINVLVFLF